MQNIYLAALAAAAIWFQYNGLCLWASRLAIEHFKFDCQRFQVLLCTGISVKMLTLLPAKLWLREQLLARPPFAACTSSIYYYILLEFPCL